jgi:hypothetical protein
MATIIPIRTKTTIATCIQIQVGDMVASSLLGVVLHLEAPDAGTPSIV